MDRKRVLVIGDGQADPLDEITVWLANHDGLALVEPEMLSLAQGLAVLSRDKTIDAVLVIGRNEMLDDTVEAIRREHEGFHIVTIAVLTGETSVRYENPNFSEIGEVLRTLPRIKRFWMRRGKIIRYTAHFNQPEPDEAPPPRPVGAPHARLPAVWSARAAPANVAVLAAALEWAEGATAALLDVWSADGTRSMVFTEGRMALDEWQARLRDLFAGSDDRDDVRFGQLVDLLECEKGKATPLAAVYRLLGEHRLAFKIFVLAASAELDLRFHRQFGVLQDDYGRRRCSLGLACAIIAANERDSTPLDTRTQLAVLPLLEELGLILGEGARGFADSALEISPGLADWLANGDLEALIEPAARRLLAPIDNAISDLVPAARVRQLEKLLDSAAGTQAIEAMLVEGEDPAWLISDLAALAAPALVIAPAQAGKEPDRALREIGLAANLSGRQLVIDLTEDGEAGESLWQSLVRLLPLLVRPPLVATANPVGLMQAAPGLRFALARLPAPTPSQRAQAIKTLLADHQEHDTQLVETLAERMPLPPARLPAAALLAAEAGSMSQNRAAVWLSAFRRASGSRLPAMARRIEPSFVPDAEAATPLDRIILPRALRDQLEDLVKHVRFNRVVTQDWGFGRLVDGRGVAALFAGESGTGKTSAALAIAATIDADLFSIDLSQVVSKYIGETEKNLDAAFAEAEAANAVLLFDEADALFGKRSAVSDAHDRYANIEVAYLLQRLQVFSGLVLLTSNDAGSIDPAFARRLRFHLDFPRPGPTERLAIWEQSLPIERRAGELPLGRLAAMLDVTGGVIRQMAMHAAILAAASGGAISAAHVLAGARGQLVRQGKYEDLARLTAFASSSERKVA